MDLVVRPNFTNQEQKRLVEAFLNENVPVLQQMMIQYQVTPSGVLDLIYAQTPRGSGVYTDSEQRETVPYHFKRLFPQQWYLLLARPNKDVQSLIMEHQSMTPAERAEVREILLRKDKNSYYISMLPPEGPVPNQPFDYKNVVKSNTPPVESLTPYQKEDLAVFAIEGLDKPLISRLAAEGIFNSPRVKNILHQAFSDMLYSGRYDSDAGMNMIRWLVLNGA